MRPQQRSRGLIGRNADPSPPPPEGDRTLLTASDFTYEGYYILSRYLYHNGGDVFGEGLTHRYVDGQLRLIYRGSQIGSPWPQPFREVTIPNSFGAEMPMVNTYLTPWLGYWDDILCHSSCWYEEETGRLWSASGFDYPGGDIPQNTTQTLYTRSIEPTSTPGEWTDCTNHSGWFGFQGIGSRALFGKVQRVPDSARTQYGFHKYMSLSGGYTSLMNQGLGPSLGPMFVSFPELHGNYTPREFYYTGNYNVPSSDFQICGDMRGGTSGTDWYDSGYSARGFDRGVRLTGVQNYCDNGDPRENPSTPPTDPPLSTAEWLSQPTIASVPGDPNGWNRWVWGDSYNGSGCWIDNNAGTRTKHGILMVPMLWAGKVYYMTSSVHRDFSAFEMQVFHPEDLAAVKNGTLDAWKIRPRSIWVPIGAGDLLPTGNTASATFDATTNKLYVAIYGQIGRDRYDANDEAQTRVYQYAVAT